jgi:hypothetical protein
MSDVPRRPRSGGNGGDFWEVVGIRLTEWAVRFIVPDLRQDLLKAVHVTAKLALESELPAVRKAYAVARAFWQLVHTEMTAAAAGDQFAERRVRQMLDFPEPKSIRFGYAKEGHSGHGIGKKTLNQFMFSVLSTNPVYRQMLAEEPDSTCLIDGVGLDRASDILTTVIMGPLCEFTEWCAEFYGFVDSCMKETSMRVWSPEERRFIM